MDWLRVVWLLAAGDEKAPPQSPFESLMPFVPLIAIALFFYFFVIRNQKREQASREALLAGLKKNDKVQTIGGIIGSVANISPDGQEVTLKVDDNTRIKFVRTAIQKVVKDEAEAAKPAETK
jgi:preprotein translocase subunit YajC